MPQFQFLGGSLILLFGSPYVRHIPRTEQSKRDRIVQSRDPQQTQIQDLPFTCTSRRSPYPVILAGQQRPNRGADKVTKRQTIYVLQSYHRNNDTSPAHPLSRRTSRNKVNAPQKSQKFLRGVGFCAERGIPAGT
jgi:hypothetical protein